MSQAVFFPRDLEPVVCGVHALNGVGFNPHQLWALRRADVRAIAESPFRLPDGGLATMAHMRVLPANEYGAPRLLILLEQALGGWLGWAASRVGAGRLVIALALPERHAEGGSNERFAKERSQLEQAARSLLTRAGIEAQLALHAYGHAGPAYSVQWAGQLVQDGAADFAIIVGVDTYYDPDVIDALVEWRRLFDGRRLDGFVPGEGAAMVAIASARFARHHALPIMARIEAASVGHEPLCSFVGPNLGDGLTDTVGALTDRLAESQRAVHWWLGDVSTESYRVRELQLALPRFSAHVSSPSSLLEQLPEHFGDLGAATIPTGIAIAVESFMRGDPSASNCMLFASSDSATRGAVLLRNPFAERADA